MMAQAAALTQTVKALVGPKVTVWLRCQFRGLPMPNWGNLRRTAPFSANYGFERGTPIDRYYLHAFLDRHRDLIAGDVLEVQFPDYTRRYGHHLRRTDTFDVVPDARPTFVCDLAHCGHVLPSDGYDCLLLPNTLQHLRELEACLHHAIRVVRPGGSILASMAGFLPLTPDVPDYWRLSVDGWRELLARVWPGHEVDVRGHGNCLAATAAMLGLATEELRARELDAFDPRYPVLMTMSCRKSGASAP